MANKTLMAIALVAVFLMGVAIPQKPTYTVEPSVAARYQAFNFKVPGNATNGTVQVYEEVILLDTATSELWIYQPQTRNPPAGEEGNHIFIPAHFEHIPVDGRDWSLNDYIDAQIKSKFPDMKGKK